MSDQHRQMYWPLTTEATFSPATTRVPQPVSASHTTPPRAPSHSKPMDISRLMMSPADEPVESFERGSYTHHKMAQPSAQRPPSPPISPYTADLTRPADVAHTEGPRDPIVVPDAAPESPVQPLFREITPRSRETIDNHLRENHSTNPTGNHPTKEQYSLVAYFCENMMGHFNKDRQKWLAREKKQLVEDNRARQSANALKAQAKPTSPRSQLPSKTLAPRPPGIIAAARPDPIQSTTAPRHPNRVEKTTASNSRVSRGAQLKERPSSFAPQASRVRQAAATKEDKDWKAIPDYCPPLTSLKNSEQGKEDIQLKVEWKGANSALDLSNDPLRHLLHPSELKVASHLRLDCATYLTSKRRIFHRRLVHYHDGKEFRKTHAQNATRIDVNKASKLHTAFEEVGWFRPEWMKNFAYPADLASP